METAKTAKSPSEKFGEGLRWLIVVLLLLIVVSFWRQARPAAWFWYDLWFCLNRDSSAESVDALAWRIDRETRSDREFEFYFKHFLIDSFAARHLELDQYVNLCKQQNDLASVRVQSGRYYREYCQTRADLIQRGSDEMGQGGLVLNEYSELLALGFAASAAGESMSRATWANTTELTFAEFAAFLQYAVFETDLVHELLYSRDVCDIRLVVSRLNHEEMNALNWPLHLGAGARLFTRGGYGLRVSGNLTATLYQQQFRDGILELLKQLNHLGALKPFQLAVVIQSFDGVAHHVIFQGFIVEERLQLVKSAPPLAGWEDVLNALDQLDVAIARESPGTEEFGQLRTAIQQLQAQRRQFESDPDARTQAILDQDLAELMQPEVTTLIQRMFRLYLLQHPDGIKIQAVPAHLEFQCYRSTEQHDFVLPIQERLKSLNLPIGAEDFADLPQTNRLTPRQMVNEMNDIVQYLAD